MIATHTAPARDASAAGPGCELARSLADPRCYPHPAQDIQLIETHISLVFLAGEFAYKIKKPVRLGFLDFGTLQARRHFCKEELRLNRRTAPRMYLEVVPIAGTPAAPRVGGSGPAFEYAVKMRRFPQEDLLDRIASRGRLTPAMIDRLACAIARFHASVPAAGADSAFGSGEAISAQTAANFSEMAQLGLDVGEAVPFAAVRGWSEREIERLQPLFAARKAQARVRECHGDLHLGNIALLDGDPTPFDCIDFNEGLRWNDVASEMAFLAMDLLHHGEERLAFRCLNAYLEESGDYGALAVLRHYLVYRAMVRAKVARIRAVQTGAAHSTDCDAHLRLAHKLARSARPALILMHGLSASGKTVLSAELLERLGGVRLRSDVERKRLAGLAPAARTGSALAAGLYDADATRRTYDRLLALAREYVPAGWPIIIDATFLKRAERDAFRELAARLGALFAIVSCRAPQSTLRARLRARAAAGADASEATLEVLDHQTRTQEALGAAEIPCVHWADTGSPDNGDFIVQRILASLAQSQAG